MEVERERKNKRWSEKEKQEIISETYRAGANISEIARRHKMSVGQLFTWRRKFKEGHKQALANTVEQGPDLKALKERIAILERILGRQLVELEIKESKK